MLHSIRETQTYVVTYAKIFLFRCYFRVHIAPYLDTSVNHHFVRNTPIWNLFLPWTVEWLKTFSGNWNRFKIIGKPICDWIKHICWQPHYFWITYILNKLFILSYIISCPILSYPIIISYHIISYHIISNHIISYHISLHDCREYRCE